MNTSNDKALDAAIELTKTKLQSSTTEADEVSGKNAVDFLNKIYNGIKTIIETTE